jgi:uncharacterized flavoprotein (TIGR03862 family)
MPEDGGLEQVIGKKSSIVIIGAGPAGLMAAEILASAGRRVMVYDRKPTPARKFLMAGRGGLNLTHSEDIESFIKRYGAAAERLDPVIRAFPPAELQKWCEGLGQSVFVGSSGRVFPKAFKASPLLRAWMARLEQLGVEFKFNQDWQGWDKQGRMIFASETVEAETIILALGGASWPRLGADGGWVKILEEKSIEIAPLRPANCGFVVEWSDIFSDRHAGEPLKPVMLKFEDQTAQGEMMITKNGIEGGAVYALSSKLREAIAKHGLVVLAVDLRPGLSTEALTEKLKTRRGRQTFTSWLRKASGLSPAAISLLMELPERKGLGEWPAEKLAGLIKVYPLRLIAPFGIDRAISSAGGIKLSEVDEGFMLKKQPGIYAVGEMLDWEAPTGGYLLQACLSTAVCAAKAILAKAD